MTRNQTTPRRQRRPEIFSMSGQQCVWSQAGVAAPRLCQNAFDCLNCTFDRRVQTELARGRLTDKTGRAVDSWHDVRQPASNLDKYRCRHMLSGYVPVKYCSHNFNCANCEFDQLVEEEIRAQELDEPMVELVDGFAMPAHYYFHRGHAWARVEYGGRVRIGLDDFITRLLGPLDQVELPALGRTLGQGEPGMGLAREGHQAKVLSPLQGVVVAVNPEIKSRARLANERPYGGGWLCMVQPTRLAGDLHNLMRNSEAENWLGSEANRLGDMVAEQTRFRLAATGGRMVADIYGEVPGLEWKRIVNEFLLN